MITHLKETAGPLSLHFLSAPPTRSPPYKLDLWAKQVTRRALLWVLRAGPFLSSRVEHNVKRLLVLWRLPTWKICGGGHRHLARGLNELIFLCWKWYLRTIPSPRRGHAPQSQVAPQWKKNSLSRGFKTGCQVSCTHALSGIHSGDTDLLHKQCLRSSDCHCAVIGWISLHMVYFCAHRE